MGSGSTKTAGADVAYLQPLLPPYSARLRSIKMMLNSTFVLDESVNEGGVYDLHQ